MTKLEIESLKEGYIIRLGGYEYANDYPAG